MPSNTTSLRGPTLAAAAMLAVLLGLGFWQVHRLHWKESLLARLHESEALPPAKLSDHPDSFQKIWVRGTFRPGTLARYAAENRNLTVGKQTEIFMGSRVLQVLDRAGEPPLLVDRGWARTDLPVPDAPKGVVEVDGYVHPADRANWLSASDMPRHRWFFTLNPVRIGAVIGVAGLEPYTLVELGDRETQPIPAPHLPEPPNNHLSYAVTWFSFAIILTAIYFMWLSEALRKKGSGDKARFGSP